MFFFFFFFFFFFQAEDGIRDWSVTGVQTCALPISPRTVGDTGLVAQHCRCLLGIVLARPGTLLRFGFALLQGLPHLERHGARVLGPALPQDARRLAHRLPALRVGEAPPRPVGGDRLIEDSLERGRRRLGERLQDLAGGGIDGADAHAGATSGRSRTRSTVQRNPSGSALVAWNWWYTPGDTYTQSNGAMSYARSPRITRPAPRSTTTACGC